MELSNYHLDELRIAITPGHGHRIMPPVLKTDRTILDVGCGAGQTLIATALGSKITLIGLDQDKSALKLGTQLDQTIAFVCAKGEHLPFQNESFDFVFSRVALPYMHIRETVSEVWRVVKTEGRVWFVLHPFSMALKETMHALLRLKIKRSVVCLYVIANGIVLNSLGKEFHLPFRKDYYESFQSIGGMRKVLRQAGFDDIQIERNRFFVASARKLN